VPKSFGDRAPNIENFRRLRRKTAENFRHVTASLGGCRNQNFVRRVTRHMGCRTDLNGTVSRFHGLPAMYSHVGNISRRTMLELEYYASEKVEIENLLNLLSYGD
jgi:hypothetical protein